MPIDDLYKKLREPDPDSFPKLEEESWKKMEVLLDKHLPENNDRVFPYILFLSCVILASLTTFIPARRTSQPYEGRISSANSLTANHIPVIEKTAVPQSPVADEENNTHSTNPEILTEKIVTTELKPTKPNQNRLTLFQTEKDEPKQKEFVKHTIPEAPVEVSLTPAGRVASLTDKNNFLLLTNKPAKNSSLVVTSEKSAAIRKPVKNNFSLTFSTGLETPGTAFNTWGKLTPLVGVGVQYSFRNRIALRTGIASATKIYTARDKDYNPANSTWTNYVYFKKIDADCKIIEIPLSVAYRIATVRQTSMYISAGASSYIMRKEAYEYYYKNQYGRDTVTTRSWNNNSFHLFSSVNVSAIVERKITNRFSLMAEPSIKIPTAGIGYGKVRLYNAGVIVSARFKLR